MKMEIPSECNWPKIYKRPDISLFCDSIDTMSFQKLSPEVLRQHKGISFTGITTVFFCYDAAGRLFLAKRSGNARDEHGRWEPGAGGLKHGQTVEDSLRRELLEELNVEPLTIDFIGYFDTFRDNANGLRSHWVALCFAVKVDPISVRINEPEMVDDSGWFALDNLPSPLHSQFEVFFTKYRPVLETIIQSSNAQG